MKEHTDIDKIISNFSFRNASKNWFVWILGY